MSLRRMTMAVALVCGLCVWGFAHSDAEPVRAQGADPVADEDEDGDTRDEAAARYRANQSRHWRHVAIGSSTAH